MAIYRHPHLTRGIVHTSEGAFALVRGTVELPDEIGARVGWARARVEFDGAPVGRLASDPHARLATGSKLNPVP